MVTSQFDKNDKSVGALTSRNAVLNKEIESQKEKITTLKSALDNASASFGENDKRTQNWQTALNKAESELNNMQRELESNNKALMSNAERYDALGKEIDDTVREYGKSAKNTEKTAMKLRLLRHGLRI